MRPVILSCSHTVLIVVLMLISTTEGRVEDVDLEGVSCASRCLWQVLVVLGL